MHTLKVNAVNALVWSALSLGVGVFLVTSLLFSGWVALQILVFLVQQ